MRKKTGGTMRRKLLCLALSMSMVTGNVAPAVIAADTEAVKETASAPQLTCETKALKLPDNGRPIDIKLCLTQEDALIQQKIFPEDITLGGVFRNMIVEDVRNDHKTVLLDLYGIPELTGADTGALLQGTVEFPGFLFDCDESVTASVDVIKVEGKEEEARPYIQPYLDGLRVNGDKAEMIFVLVPVLGEFAEDFSAEDISFGRDLREAKIRKGRETEDGSYEFIADVPVAAMDVDDGYSCFGGIILDENSMTGSDGKLYGKKVYAAGRFSKDAAGRDLSTNDVSTIKNIVGGYGNTTAGTISGVLSAGGTAFSVGSTVLGLAGVIPNEASRHKALMEQLLIIQNQLYDIEQKCDYMSGVCDVHTAMLQNIMNELKKKQLLQFNKDLKDLVNQMDLLEEYLQDSLVQEQIDEIFMGLCEKYQVPKSGAGRDIDEDMIVPDEEYYEGSYDLSEDRYAAEVMDFDMLIATGGLFEEAGADSGVPDAISPADDTVQPVSEGTTDAGEQGSGMEETEADGELQPAQEETQAAEAQSEEEETTAAEAQSEEEETTAAEAQPEEEETTAAETQSAEEETQKMEAASADEDQTAEKETEETAAGGTQNAETETKPAETETQPAETEEKAAQTIPAETENASEVDEIETERSSEEETETGSEEETETESEPVTEWRELDREEKISFLTELSHAIVNVQCSSTTTIGDYIGKIRESYMSLVDDVDSMDYDVNPIAAYCECEDAVNNFATTTLAEKEMYKADIKYQLARALNYLVIMEDFKVWSKRQEAFNQRTATADAYGNPKQDKWLQVENVPRPARDENGNPYSTIMGGYVRLADKDELMAFFPPLYNTGKEKEIFIYNRSDVKPVKVYAQEFAKRMNGRTLQEELELAGIQNLEAIQNEKHTRIYVNKKGKKSYDEDITNYGILFNLERWGIKRSKVPINRKDFTRLSDHEYYWMGDGLSHDYYTRFESNDDYLLVTTDCIRWNSNKPSGSYVVYDTNKEHDADSWCMPFTFFVVVK